MTSKSIGFVGGGRIVRVFLDGWQRAQALPPRIVVSDCNADTLAKLKTRWSGVETTSASTAAAGQDIVFLAVHPPVLPEVCAGIKTALRTNAIVVSLAPKFHRGPTDRTTGRLCAHRARDPQCPLDHRPRLQPGELCARPDGVGPGGP